MLVKQIINHICFSNTFILYTVNNKDVWIVDAGDTSKALGWMYRHNKILRGVFLTHSHFDHIYGLNNLLFYNPDIPIFTSSEGMEGLYNDKLNLSRFNFTPFIFRGSNVICIDEGDLISLWPGVNAIVMKTPGHDWSCLSYEIEGSLFTGDAYIPGLKVITSFPKSNKQEAIKSELRIVSKKNIRVIYPGHGNVLIKN